VLGTSRPHPNPESTLGGRWPGASGYNLYGPEPGRQERRSPDRQELAPRAHRAELEFGAPVVVSRCARADRHTSLDADARQPCGESYSHFSENKRDRGNPRSRV